MKILVVDDEQDIKTLFEQRFRREIRDGVFAFTFCFSGDEALAFYRQHPAEIVLILSDINMPGMSGLELLRQLRQSDPAAPPFILMITAYADAANRSEAERLGADDFLQKPLDFSALKQKITSFS